MYVQHIAHSYIKYAHEDTNFTPPPQKKKYNILIRLRAVDG